MDALLLHRIHFAFTITFHYLGMPGLLCTSFSERNWSTRSWKWHEERSIHLSRL